MRRYGISMGLMAAALLVVAACAEDDSSSEPTLDRQPGTIVEVASEAGSFNTLLAAVEAAGLTSVLQGEGPFTVFAPTDAAFDALPAGMVDDLLADPEALSEVLLYHVAPGDLDSGEVASSSLIASAMGTDLRVTAGDGSVMVGSAMIVTADIPASNGTIHVIDSVITPPGTIADVALDSPDLTTLVTALQEADLVETLRGDGPFTVFAPTDSAFAAVPSEALEALLADTEALTDVLLYHVVAGKLPASDVLSSSSLTTVETSPLSVRLDGGRAMVGDAQIIVTDIPASNGVIHLIDEVLFPPAE